MGITICAGGSGDCDALFDAFLAGKVEQVKGATCDCHGRGHGEGHEHGHEGCGCGGHGAGHGEGHEDCGCGCH
ncbi:hypothetical protein [uncultured Parolsenella sp.]|uniref:hypothetical protein n=1 Tax=uncultured Parolsenella sp. TaxID=2083008 RepID=UPI0025F789EE|nr:hypothetical protein [uncultured Parolsenella sp.]